MPTPKRPPVPPAAASPARFTFGSRLDRHAGPAAFTRIFALHDLLAAGKPLNAVAFAADHELSPRTVKRDIERLRDFHRAPIIWDHALKSYRYTAPFDLARGLRLDADEALAVVLAGRTFAAWGETPLGRTLAAALGKIAEFAGSAVSLPATDLQAALYQPEMEDPAHDTEHRHFARLLDLVLARREIELLYRKPRSTRPELRRVRPLHLAYLDHRWVLLADDLDRAAWRKFVLSRIQEIRAVERLFTPPPREQIRAHLAGSLGRFTGDEDHEVRLRFDATAAPYVRERAWHASQSLRELPDDAVEATLRLNNLIDVKRRVLANGRHVEVLAPPELRAEVAAELAALVRAYAPELTAAEKNSAPRK